VCFIAGYLPTSIHFAPALAGFAIPNPVKSSPGKKQSGATIVIMLSLYGAGITGHLLETQPVYYSSKEVVVV